METPNEFSLTQNDHVSIESPKKAPGSKKKAVWITMIAIVLVLAAAGIFYSNKIKQDEALRQSIISSGVFHEGILVNDVSIGGMTPEEAAAAIAPTEQAMLDEIAFTLTFQGNAYPADAQIFGMQFNTQAILQEAMALGRQGTLGELQDELLDIGTNKRTFYTSCTPSEQAVEAYVAGLAEKLDTLPVDAQFTVLIDKESVSEEEKKKSAYVQAAATTTPEQRFAYTPDEDGMQVDQPSLCDTLLAMAQSGEYQDMEIPFHTTPAAVTLEDVQSKVVLRASSYTSFNKSPYNRKSRVYNIKKAVGLINGTVLQPGEEFSTNGTLGHRTFSGGWQAAPAIVQGRTEDQAGGGVCQVSTTMYLCVLKSNLEVVYRQGHSGRLTYVDGGLDATIDSGRIDFKWKNNTNSPVYLFCWVDETDKTIHFEIYGEPFPDEYDEIRLSSKHTGSISPSGPMQYTVDTTKPVGYKEVFVARKSGSVWQSYAAYLKDGKVVKTVTIDITRYKAYSGETIVGPSAVTVDAIA